MSTSSTSFENSIPSGGDTELAYVQLRRFFEQEKADGGYQKLFSTSRIFDIAGGISFGGLAVVLSYLVKNRIIDQIVRVEPTMGEGIGDFRAIEEIPEVIEDWRHGGRVRVLPEHLQVYYKLHRDS